MAFTYKGHSNPSGTIGLDQSRSLLASQLELEHILADLQVSVTEGTANKESLLKSITTAQACLPAIDKAIPEEHKSLLYPERKHTKNAAQNVFDVTELLEMVLGHLAMSELLAAQFVNRQFRDIVNQSRKLQRHLTLEAYKPDAFFAPFEQAVFPGLDCQMSVDPLLWQDDINPAMKREGAVHTKIQLRSNRLKIGSRCRKMLITQPPIQEVRAFVNCCRLQSTVDDIWEEGELIQRSSGITVGDLVDVARRLTKEHEHCGYADLPLINEGDGTVNVEVAFRAETQLELEHPVFQAERARRQAFAASTIANAKRDAMMSAWLSTNYHGKVRQDAEAVRDLDFTEWRKRYLEGQSEEDADGEDD